MVANLRKISTEFVLNLNWKQSKLHDKNEYLFGIYFVQDF